MKNLAEQIENLKAKDTEARDALYTAEAKEVNAMLKRLGHDEISFNEIFNIYLSENYPLDNNQNKLPYAQPADLNVVTICYIYVRKLPYIKAKREKWLKLRDELRKVEEALK